MNNAVPGWVLMPFGKHRNTPIKSVKTDYLKWLITKRRPAAWLASAIETELKRRPDA